MNEDLLMEYLRPDPDPSQREACGAMQRTGKRSQEGAWPIQIFAFGRFSVMKSGTALVFSHKTPKKPITLLKALIALGGREVSGHRLTDALWPNEEGDAAHDVLAVNLHRLRRLLGDRGSLTLHDGRVSLDPRRCWVDAWAFQRLLSEAAGASAGERPSLLERALKLYRGAFLSCESDEPWSLSLRERLRAKFIRHCTELGRLREESGQWEEAIACYQRGLETDELAEAFYQGLMRCYQNLDRRVEGISVYRRLRDTLSVILGIAVSPTSEELLRQLRSL